MYGSRGLCQPLSAVSGGERRGEDEELMRQEKRRGEEGKKERKEGRTGVNALCGEGEQMEE